MRYLQTLTLFAAAAASASAVPPVKAATMYELYGAVTSMPDPLTGAGLAVGDPVHMWITVDPAVPDVDPAPSVGSFAGAISSWTLQIGSFTTHGIGGDVLICNSPIPGQNNCGSANTGYGWWSGIWIGKDGVRFATRELSSAPMVLNGFSQNCFGMSVSCGNANLYNDSATALTGTDIPAVIDPVAFGSSTNNGRVGFGPGPVMFSIAVVPEPSTSALMAAGLGILGFAASRRRT